MGLTDVFTTRPNVGRVVVALGLLLTLWSAWHRAVGEPFADDFDFLHYVRLDHRWSLLDGGGSQLFWRPIPHQLYFSLVGPFLPGFRVLVPWLHVGFLGAGCYALLEGSRRRLGHLGALVLGLFPLTLETSRAVLSWPSHSVDLLLFMFSSLGVALALQSRFLLSTLAMFLAALCKETGVISLMATPLLCIALDGNRTAIRRTSVASAASLVGYLALYVYVWRHAHLQLFEHAGLGLSTAPSIQELAKWTLGGLGSALLGVRVSRAAVPGTLMIVATVLVIVLGRRKGRGASQATAVRARLSLVGLLWMALTLATTVLSFPYWANVRLLYGAIGLGLGIAAIELPWLHVGVVSLICLRIVASWAWTPKDATVSETYDNRIEFLTTPQVWRLQGLCHDIRTVLQRDGPRLRPGSVVGLSFLPQAAQYALTGNKSLQLWYADTTLRYALRTDALFGRANKVVEYEGRQSPSVVVIEGPVFHALDAADAKMHQADVAGAMRELRLAQSSAPFEARVFRGAIAYRMALCEEQAGDCSAAAEHARAALSLIPESFNAGAIAVGVLAKCGYYGEARTALDRMQLEFPPSQDLELLSRVVEESRPLR